MDTLVICAIASNLAGFFLGSFNPASLASCLEVRSSDGIVVAVVLELKEGAEGGGGEYCRVAKRARPSSNK
eukprot:6195854-Pleurochrysis_carterae.AAC.1